MVGRCPCERTDQRTLHLRTPASCLTGNPVGGFVMQFELGVWKGLESSEQRADPTCVFRGPLAALLGNYGWEQRPGACQEGSPGSHLGAWRPSGSEVSQAEGTSRHTGEAGRMEVARQEWDAVMEDEGPYWHTDVKMPKRFPRREVR